MSIEQEKYFEHLVPLKSPLGREFLALQFERDKQRKIFESSPEKMAADTLAYRRSEIALGRFLDDMIALLNKHQEKLSLAKEGLDRAEYDAKNPLWGPQLTIDRRSQRIIWTRFVIERYRQFVTPEILKMVRRYHPHLWHELRQAWREFRKEIMIWQSGHQPYDGSQAMHLMLDVQVKARILASAND